MHQLLAAPATLTSLSAINDRLIPNVSPLAHRLAERLIFRIKQALAAPLPPAAPTSVTIAPPRTTAHGAAALPGGAPAADMHAAGGAPTAMEGFLQWVAANEESKQQSLARSVVPALPFGKE